MEANRWADEVRSRARKYRTEDMKFDVTSSFAHFYPNYTIDEAFGQFRMSKIPDMFTLNVAHDMTLPKNEKPEGTTFQTMRKKDKIRLLESDEIPISRQNALKPEFPDLARYKDICKLDKLATMTTRVVETFDVLENAFKEGISARDFTERSRKGFRKLAGIEACEVPLSAAMERYAAALETEYEKGRPFWNMELTPEFAAKYKSNYSTYLVKIVSPDGQLLATTFDGREFAANGTRIKAEDSFDSIRSGRLYLTVPVLTYCEFVDSAIHVGGPFMAPDNGYARPLLDLWGIPQERLVFTGYDGRCTVDNGSGGVIGFGVVYPTFGNLTRFMNGVPRRVRYGEIVGD